MSKNINTSFVSSNSPNQSNIAEIKKHQEPVLAAISCQTLSLSYSYPLPLQSCPERGQVVSHGHQTQIISVLYEYGQRGPVLHGCTTKWEQKCSSNDLLYEFCGCSAVFLQNSLPYFVLHCHHW